MNRNQVFLLVGAAIVVGGLSLVVYNKSASTWQGGGDKTDGKVLGDFQINDVSHIVIKDKGEETNLVRKGDNWVVKERADYPANFDEVSRLIRNLWELHAVQNVKIGPSQLGRLDLNAPAKDASDSGTLVSLEDKDSKPIKSILLGKKYLKKSPEFPEGDGYPAGRYVMPEDGGTHVSLVTEILDEASAKPTGWLNHDFIHPDSIKTLTLSGTGAMNWSLSRDSESSSDWKLADAKADEKVDSGKVPSSALNGLSFQDVLAPDTKPDVTGLDKPTTITAETFDGFHYTFKLGREKDGNNVALTVAVDANLPKERTPSKDEKPADKKRLDDEFANKQKQLKDKLSKEKALEGRIFEVSKTNLNALLKDRKDLLAENKPAPSPTPMAAATPAPAKAPLTVAKGPVSVTSPAMTIVSGSAVAVPTPTASPAATASAKPKAAPKTGHGKKK